MTKDLSIIVKTVARNDLIGGIVLFLILLLLGQCKIGGILLVGTIVSMINFVVSAIVTNKFLNEAKKSKAILFPMSYLIRIVSIVAIAVVFSNKTSYLLAFLIGFFIHYIILVITTIKIQKGSE
ncbi:ATP synthase subunit I [uncultured Clostridium sp.]|uniref:ATP synthase subunit I n=1 Tax=uncultured Clostridium sp. TaxID=59620 RepID=UPI0026026DD4|nr:ATP synthase subunit I [uncultured Clostridium sp.]